MNEMMKHIFSIKSDMNGMKAHIIDLKHKLGKEGRLQKQLTKQLTADRNIQQVSSPPKK